MQANSATDIETMKPVERHIVDQDVEACLTPISVRLREIINSDKLQTECRAMRWEPLNFCMPNGQEYISSLSPAYKNLEFGRLTLLGDSNEWVPSKVDDQNTLLSVFELYCEKFESPESFLEMKYVTDTYFSMRTTNKLLVVEGSGFIMEGKSAFFNEEKNVKSLIASIRNSNESYIPITGYKDCLVIPEGDELWRVFMKGTKIPLLATEFHKYIKFLWFYSVMLAFVQKLDEQNTSKIMCIVLDRASIDHDLFDHVLGGDIRSLLPFTRWFRRVIEGKFTQSEFITMMFRKLPPWPLANKAKREFEYDYYKTKSQLHSLAINFYQARDDVLTPRFNEGHAMLDGFLRESIQGNIFLGATEEVQLLKRASQCAMYISDSLNTLGIYDVFLNKPTLVKYRSFAHPLSSYASSALEPLHHTPHSELPRCSMIKQLPYYAHDKYFLYSRWTFGEKPVEHLYSGIFGPVNFPAMFQMIASIINKVVDRKDKVMTFNKILPLKVTLIALDGFISQGKTTDLNNRIHENSPLNDNEYIIREQDHEWRRTINGEKNYVMKNHQGLLIYHLLADIYQVYMKQDFEKFDHKSTDRGDIIIYMDRGIIGHMAFQDSFTPFVLLNCFLSNLFSHVSYYQVVYKNPARNVDFKNSKQDRDFESEIYSGKDIKEEQITYEEKFDKWTVNVMKL